MKPNLKIVIFDGSFKTTTFINRLVKGLSKNHQIYILGFNNAITQKIPGVQYIDLGSSQNLLNLLWQSKWLAAKRLFKTGNFKLFFKTLRNIFTLNKKQLQQDNFNTALFLINPDIVHVQWPSLLPWCEDELEKGNYKFVLSQRGYQSNVRPFVNQENFEYLQKWYPKFAGFHSVSRAISEEGDKVHPPQSPTSTSSAHRFEGGGLKIDKVVYSGFDFKKLPFHKNLQKQSTIKILSVGRPHWKKGYKDALLACAKLKEKGIKFNYSIIGAAKNNEELLYLINDLNLESEVQLLESVSQEKVYQIIKESSLFILPSLEEGVANVVIEAMALGIPVISTDCGGMSEVVINNKTGWIVPTRNPKALSEAIIDFTNTSEEKINAIRLAARQKVENQHSVEQMVAGMEELYFEVS